jgi:hypothetical protein
MLKLNALSAKILATAVMDVLAERLALAAKESKGLSPFRYIQA